MATALNLNYKVSIISVIQNDNFVMSEAMEWVACIFSVIVNKHGPEASINSLPNYKNII